MNIYKLGQYQLLNISHSKFQVPHSNHKSIVCLPTFQYWWLKWDQWSNRWRYYWEGRAGRGTPERTHRCQQRSARKTLGGEKIKILTSHRIVISLPRIQAKSKIAKMMKKLSKIIRIIRRMLNVEFLMVERLRTVTDIVLPRRPRVPIKIWEKDKILITK